ncbi:uncharacterized protein [Nicotiana tomentosiformis]|uniref:uncharacterized protein n=1 Tax=Nicotiana tomentosiformis TaxID=4098 RepID=UPI00388C6143
MDRLASVKEATRTQLNSAEIKLRAAKERTEVQTKRVEELQLQLGSAASDRKNLAKELETVKSVAEVVKADADEIVAQYKADAEAAQDVVKNLIEHMKWQSRMEALKEVHAQGFDLSVEIEDAKIAMAKTSKSVPQQAASSSSHPTTNAEVVVSEAVIPEVAASEVAALEVAPEPPMKSFIPGGCSILDDFKVEKPSSKQDRGFPKTTELRPLKGNEDASLLIDSSITGQYEATVVEKKKRKRKSTRPDEHVAIEEKKRVVEPLPVRESEVEMEVATSKVTAPALKEAVGVIDIIETHSNTDSMLDEAQAGKEKSSEGAQGADDPLHFFFNGVDMSNLDDFTDLDDFELSKKDVPSESRGPTLSPILVNQFPALSVDPGHKRSIILTVLEDARVLSAPVGVASYLQCLVIEEDQAKMNEVGVPCLFNEAQQALNRAKLAAVEVQLRVAKEKADKWSQLNDDLRAHLSSAVAERDTLGREYEVMKSKLGTTSVDAEEMLAQYKADVEASEAHLKTNAEYMRQLSRRETLEQIHARDFDLLAEIKEAIKLEAEAKKLHKPEGVEVSEGSEGSEGLDDSGDESVPGEDQA